MEATKARLSASFTRGDTPISPSNGLSPRLASASIWRLRSSTLILNWLRMVLITSLSASASSRCSVSTSERPKSAACLAASCNSASECSLMRLANPLPRRRGMPDAVEAGSPNGASSTSSAAAAAGADSSPMRKKSLPRKSSNRPLREPKRASSGEMARFCWQARHDKRRKTKFSQAQGFFLQYFTNSAPELLKVKKYLGFVRRMPSAIRHRGSSRRGIR